MKLLFAKIFIFLLFSFLFFSCKNGNKNASVVVKPNPISNVKYAKGFDIQHFDNYIKLIIKAPYLNAKESFVYKLVPVKTDNDLETIQIPINSVVVTSTTHIPVLELLKLEDKLIGYPNTDYISSVKTRALIENGSITELGNEENINTELLLVLKPDAVIGFSMNSNNKMFATIEKLGIPVLLNGDWLEESPLGRAEWIKFFGVLFDKEKEADSIFSSIEKNYLEAKKIALDAVEQPTIISGGLFKDIWNLPAGESFEATFLKDANTNYLWKNSKGKGSLSLNIEHVFEKGQNADIWISPSFYKSFEELYKANSIYSKFKAFQHHKIYTFVNKRGEKGGVIYFELGPARPDLVLKDLIKIAHPELLADYELAFFDLLE